MSQSLARQQLQPGERLDKLQDVLLSSVHQSMSWEKMTSKVIISSSPENDVRTISLLEWTRQVLLEGATTSFFGPSLLELEPQLFQSFFSFDDKSWKLTYNIPAPWSNDMRSAKATAQTALTNYFEMPKDRRPGACWLVETLEKEMKAVGIQPPDIAAYLMMYYWVINANSWKVSFWMLAYLIHDPSLLMTISEEISPMTNSNPTMSPNELVASFNSTATPQLLALYHEVIRIVTSSVSVRNVAKSVFVGGKQLQPGGRIIVPYRQLLLNDDVFGRDASEFNHERFLHRDGILSNNPSYRPFGGGSTYCPGRFLAKAEILTCVALAIGRFDMQLVSGNYECKKGAEESNFPRLELQKPCLGIMNPKEGDDVVVNICIALASSLGSDKVWYSNSTIYEDSAMTYFAQQEGELSPYCYVKPECSQDVANSVHTLARLNGKEIVPVCPFAVRSGGHHTVIGIANIHNGITIDLRNLNKTTVSRDKKTAFVEPGARSGSVYETLVPLGLALPGGRIGDIGVGGFTSGGGISYFGAAYGFRCDMVENFEIVVASGNIINANLKSNADLFKALKGGLNNFGIITRLDMRTFKLGQYWGGQIYYVGTKSPQLIDAFVDYTTNPNFDGNSALILTTIYTPEKGYIALGDFSYTKSIQRPAIFDCFIAGIPALIEDVRVSNLSDFASTFGANIPENLRQTSITATVKPSSLLLRDIYNLWNETVPVVALATNLVYSLTFQPLPVSMLAKISSTGGNSLGLGADDGPLVVLTLTTQYTSSEFDAVITSTTRANGSMVTMQMQPSM
ncbi:putative oxidoreductase, FAD-binding [Sclerotinia borealis F-4128]|uniref:Putative oxidoreductase, FAD-binding n=1 Tax=Sclerotinia borealis (strain F-4128) TaxID=1432307 RepID=W9CJE7_SCLBF|nr:putative oxidoreductase, FAD-binding [Sclerotinia borealis F-4128]